MTYHYGDRYLVRVGSHLAATKGFYRTEREAKIEVANRLSGSRNGGIAAHFTLTFGADRLDEIAEAWVLTPEREAAYKQVAHEASVAYRKNAKALVKAQVAGQGQFAQAA